MTAAPAEVPGVVGRPELAMPAPETAAVTAAYEGASVILEYGMGGSTALAAAMPGKRLFSVDSDAAWLARIRDWFEVEPPKAEVVLHHADIGPTRDWGHPVDERAAKRWPDYALSVWDRADFVPPDVILVDGRFRVACLLAAAFRTAKPVTVLVDDYAGRRHYHSVEDLFRPTAMIGRMARFEIAPQPVPADRLGWIISQFMRPA